MTTANDRDRVAAIEARVNAATPGTWYWAEGSTEPRELLSQVEDDPFPQDVLWANNINPIRFERPGNQEFIANAPADIAYLLARVRETEAALETCKRKLNLERGFVEYLTGASDENL